MKGFNDSKPPMCIKNRLQRYDISMKRQKNELYFYVERKTIPQKMKSECLTGEKKISSIFNQLQKK